MNKLKFLQLNCCKNRTVGEILETDIGDKDVLLLSEPPTKWIKKDDGTFKRKIDFDTKIASAFYDENSDWPKACIILNKVLARKAKQLENLCNEHIVVVEITVKEEGGKSVKILCVSVYFPCDSTVDYVKNLMSNVFNYVKTNKIKTIIGGDTNIHGFWGNDYNDRGEDIYNLFLRNNFHLLNEIGAMTFKRNESFSTIDLTFANDEIFDEVVNWNVNHDFKYPTDHFPITFEIFNKNKIEIKTINFKDVNENVFCEELKKNIKNGNFLKYISKRDDLNHNAFMLEKAINKAIEKSCETNYLRNVKEIKWMNNTIEQLKKEIMHIENEIENANFIQADESEIRFLKIQRKFKISEYSKEIEIAKEKSFKKFASEIDSLSDCAKLLKINKVMLNSNNKMIKNVNGNFAKDEKESLKILNDHHFANNTNNRNVDYESFYATFCEKKRIKKWLKIENLKECVNEFKPFKATGMDNIPPKMLQIGMEILYEELKKIFYYCLTTGSTPRNWLRVRVVFIPKPNKKCYNDKSSYRPISLTSFFLKLIEKILVKFNYTHIEKLHKNQFGFIKNKCTVQALHELTNVIKKRMDRRKTTMCFFSDISSAFDKTNFDLIKNKLYQNNLPRVFTEWFNNMNRNRILHTCYGDSESIIRCGMGVGQGSACSPLIWCIYVNDLVIKLNEIVGIKAYFFADDVAILCDFDDEERSQRRLNYAIEILDEWCNNNGLSISLEKSSCVRFSRKRANGFNNIMKLRKENLTLANEVKYLGVTLDKRLNFQKHVSEIKKNLIKLSMRMRCFIGKNWGVEHKMLKWSYTSIAIPKMSYASSIWIEALRYKTTREKLHRAQNCITRTMTKTLQSTPSLSVQATLNLLPITSVLRSIATKEFIRLINFNKIDFNNEMHTNSAYKWAQENLDILELSNKCDKKLNIINNHVNKIILPTRQEWEEGNISNEENDIKVYVDASVERDLKRTGIGIFIPKLYVRKAEFSNNVMSSFMAECYAIKKALCILNEHNIYEHNINFYSDSMSALQIMKRKKWDRKILCEINEQINLLSLKLNELKFIWIPAHTNIENEMISGNDVADILTRYHNATWTLELEEAYYSEKKLKEILNEREKNKEKIWPINSHFVSKKFKLNEYYSNNINLSHWKREDLNAFIRFVTDHSCLSHNMKYIIYKDPMVMTCRYCLEQGKLDSSVHIISECEYFNNWRWKIFNKISINMDEEFLEPEDILKFLKHKKIYVRLLTWCDSIQEAERIIKKCEEEHLEICWENIKKFARKRDLTE